MKTSGHKNPGGCGGHDVQSKASSAKCSVHCPSRSRSGERNQDGKLCALTSQRGYKDSRSFTPNYPTTQSVSLTFCLHIETLGSHPWTELHTGWGGPCPDTVREELGGNRLVKRAQATWTRGRMSASQEHMAMLRKRDRNNQTVTSCGDTKLFLPPPLT